MILDDRACLVVSSSRESSKAQGKKTHSQPSSSNAYKRTQLTSSPKFVLTLHHFTTTLSSSPFYHLYPLHLHPLHSNNVWPSRRRPRSSLQRQEAPLGLDPRACRRSMLPFLFLLFRLPPLYQVLRILVRPVNSPISTFFFIFRHPNRPPRSQP